MFGSNRQVLKSQGNIQLIKSVQHGYGFTSKGRGTIKTTIRYHVEYSDSDTTENYSGRFNMTSKSEAMKIFKQVTKFGMGSLVQGTGA